MSCKRWEESIALYVGGDLEPGEAALVERHLADCASCCVLAANLQDIHLSLRGLGMETPEEEVFPGIRRRILSQVEQRRRHWPRVAALAAGFFLVLAAPAVQRFFRDVPPPPAARIQIPGPPLALRSARDAPERAEARQVRKAPRLQRDRTSLSRPSPSRGRRQRW